MVQSVLHRLLDEVEPPRGLAVLHELAMPMTVAVIAPIVGLAHEWGHHVQAATNVPFPRTLRERVNYENQADCISGAWTRYADEQGWLERPDDLEDVEGLMRAIGTRESRNRDHGTVAERAHAFNRGFDAGLGACNAFTAATPIA